jgi:hypothetical protein
MRWIGKHKVFQDLMIGGVLFTPPDPQYEYELTLPNDDGSAGQVLTTDGSGVLTWTSKTGGSGVTMTNGVNNRVMTATAAQAITGEADFTFDDSIKKLFVGAIHMRGPGSNNVFSYNGATFASYLEMPSAEAFGDVSVGSVIKVTDGSGSVEAADLMIEGGNAAGTNMRGGIMRFNLGTHTGSGTPGSFLFRGSGATEIAKIYDTGLRLPIADQAIVFEGGSHDTTFKAQTTAGAARTITLPDATGTVALTSDITNTTLNGTTVGGVATYASANTLDIEPDFTWDGSDLHVSSSVDQKPQLIIENTNTNNKPPSIKFLKDKGAAGVDGDYTGTIKWYGDNSAQTETQFGQIRTRIVTALATDEASKMEIDVAASNGTTSQLRNMIEGEGHGTNDTVNVSLGYGATSATTIAGTLTMGSTAAMTNAGLLSVGNQSNITGLGTISSGVWEGTAIGVAHGGTGLTTVGTNYLLTGNGTSALSAESGLQYTDSNEKLKINGTSDVDISSDATSGYDVFNFAYGSIHFNPYNVFGTGVGNIVEMKDFTTGSATGAAFGIKGGGGYGTNKTGGNIEVVAGRGTGTGAGGSFRFWSSPAGSSGSSYNTSLVKFSVNSVGDTTVYGDLTVSGGDITLSGTGRIQGVDTVSASTDAASKGYVDGLIPTVPDEVISAGTHIHKQTKVTIDQAGCNALNSSPQTLVAAQGANKIIIPVEVTCLVDRNSADTSASSLIVGWNGTTSYTYALKYARRWMYGIATDMTFVLGGYLGRGAASLTGGENVALTISTDTAISSNSLTSMTVYTSYYVIDNS